MWVTPCLMLSVAFQDCLPHILVQTQHGLKSDQTDSREKEFLRRWESSGKQKHKPQSPHEAGCHPVLLWFQHEKWLQRMNQKSFVIRFSPSLPLTSALSFPYTRALVAHCNSLKKDLLVFLLFSQVCLSISCLIWTYKSNSCSLSNTEVVFVIIENHSNTP